MDGYDDRLSSAVQDANVGGSDSNPGTKLAQAGLEPPLIR
jgi:hypothetical protein